MTRNDSADPAGATRQRVIGAVKIEKLTSRVGLEELAENREFFSCLLFVADGSSRWDVSPQHHSNPGYGSRMEACSSAFSVPSLLPRCSLLNKTPQTHLEIDESVSKVT